VVVVPGLASGCVLAMGVLTFLTARSPGGSRFQPFRPVCGHRKSMTSYATREHRVAFPLPAVVEQRSDSDAVKVP
jgi:hypothetical protein